MAGSDDAQRVTSAAVRDGEPAALAALCATDGPAVLAYASTVLDPETAVRAAAEAFARFRAVALALGDGAVPEGLLLSATRRAVAALVPPPPPNRLGARRTCPHMPMLLVARLEGELSAADRARVVRHLGRCTACKGLAARFDAAEHAFAEPPPGPPPPQATAAIVGALAAAGDATPPPPAPAPPAPPPEPRPVAPPPATTHVGALDPPVPAPVPETEAAAAARLPPPPPAPVPPADDAITALMPPVGHARDVAPAEGPPAARAAPAFARPARPRVHLPDSGLLRTVVLPLVVVGVAAVLAMAIAGVFGEDEPAPLPSSPPIGAPAESIPGGTPAPPSGERVRPGSAPPPGIPTTPAQDFAGGLGVPGPGVGAQ